MPLRPLVLGVALVTSGSANAQSPQSAKPLIVGVDNSQPTAAPAADLTVLENKLGIGTATPAFKLDVIGQINGSGGLCMGGDCRTTWPGGGTAGPWTLSGTSVLYGDGNVGIGSSSPPTSSM